MPEKKDARFYWKLFMATFLISAFTFGGGYVIVTLLRKRFVDEYGWIEENEMLDMVAIAQSTPGPLAVNASLLVGYRLAGVKGALLTVLATVLPPFFTISVVSLFYTAFASNRIVALTLRGMQAGVAAVIVSVVLSMGLDILKKKQWLPIVIMVVTLLLSLIWDTNVMFLILACALVGAADTLWRQRKAKGEQP